MTHGPLAVSRHWSTKTAHKASPFPGPPRGLILSTLNTSQQPHFTNPSASKLEPLQYLQCLLEILGMKTQYRNIWKIWNEYWRLNDIELKYIEMIRKHPAPPLEDAQDEPFGFPSQWQPDSVWVWGEKGPQDPTNSNWNSNWNQLIWIYFQLISNLFGLNGCIASISCLKSFSRGQDPCHSLCAKGVWQHPTLSETLPSNQLWIVLGCFEPVRVQALKPQRDSVRPQM